MLRLHPFLYKSFEVVGVLARWYVVPTARED